MPAATARGVLGSPGSCPCLRGRAPAPTMALAKSESAVAAATAGRAAGRRRQLLGGGLAAVLAPGHSKAGRCLLRFAKSRERRVPAPAALRTRLCLAFDRVSVTAMHCANSSKQGLARGFQDPAGQQLSQHTRLDAFFTRSRALATRNDMPSDRRASHSMLAHSP